VTRFRILSWRGIPAQVKVYRDNGRALSVPLPDWFMQEIDRVAMTEGIVGTDEYLEQWQWSDDLERPGTAEEVGAALVAELEAEWIER
jgi:Virulence factor